MTKLFFIIIALLSSSVLHAQTVDQALDQVSKEGILQMVRDLSGESDITINGRTSRIPHRVSIRGNDLAADYLLEKLRSYGLPVEDINYRAGGRNIIATQEGRTNPSDIYIICGHYDTVVEGGADDNASGTAAVLEAARILSSYNLEYTVKYALWDEEENGLIGSRDYAQKAAAAGENILAVLNIDMIGYDGNQNKRFDIDVRSIGQSRQISTDLLGVVRDHNLDLVGHIVDPGTPASDHGPFWDVGYSAVLLGEGWSEDDVNPGYHRTNDRIGLFDTEYFFKLVKLVVGYTATKATILNSVSTSFINQFAIQIYPNPTRHDFNIELDEPRSGKLEVLSTDGSMIFNQNFQGSKINIASDALSSAVYIVKIIDESGLMSYGKIVVE